MCFLNLIVHILISDILPLTIDLRKANHGYNFKAKHIRVNTCYSTVHRNLDNTIPNNMISCTNYDVKIDWALWIWKLTICLR